MEERKTLSVPAWITTAGQAITVGGLAGFGLTVALFFLALLLDWDLRVAAVGPVVGGLLLFVAPIVLVLNDRGLLWSAEKVLKKDIDMDGYIGRPPTPQYEERPFVYVHNARQQLQQIAADDFRFFLKEVWNGRGTTLEQWNGARLPSGRKMGQSQWEDYCDRLLRAGLAERPYPTSTLALTASLPEALQAFREAL